MPLVNIDHADACRYAEKLAYVRIAIGVCALLAPDLVTVPWVGRTTEREARAVLSRGLGARDIALGLGTLLAARQNGKVRGWVEAGGLADAGDLVSTIVGYRHLPRTGRLGVAALTAGAVAAAAVLAPALD